MGGSLKYEEITSATNTKFSNFVETGTYKAETTLMASEHFSAVYTIEIVKELYEYSKHKAQQASKNNITFYLGDSITHLPSIIPKVLDGAVFFIDAHQSGADTSNNGKHVPLLDELKIILSHRIGKSLFIFDDVRFWIDGDKTAWDWIGISTQGIINEFFVHNYHVEKFFIKNDLSLIHI